LISGTSKSYRRTGEAGTRAAGEKRGVGPVDRVASKVSDGVDAAIHPNQASVVDPPRNRPWVKTDSEQLRSRDVATLRACIAMHV
jgi:hypothetical protein